MSKPKDKRQEIRFSVAVDRVMEKRIKKLLRTGMYASKSDLVRCALDNFLKQIAEQDS